MRKVLFLCAAAAAVASVGCKKKGDGGGGGWFVGERGLMANVDEAGDRGDGYELGADATLHAIACRYLDEAWVAGAGGTLLHTADAGASWDSHDLGTTADLRDLATQDAGPVFVVGDGVFFTAVPEYASGRAAWAQLGDGSTRFLSVAAAQRASTVLAASDDGTIWSYVAGQLVPRSSLAGVRSIAVAPAGRIAFAVGMTDDYAGLLAKSVDGGHTWTPIEGAAIDGALHDVRVDDAGRAVAVGDDGLMVRIDETGSALAGRIGDAALRTLHVAPGHHGYAAGDGGQTWMTHDGGATWTAGPNLGRTVLGVDEIGEGHN